ncbi:hypothetical protein AMK59_8361, partial [Oryctes borbonicus]
MASTTRLKVVKSHYGQLIIGPPGSGKTTYCEKISKFYKKKLSRNVHVINLDPANDNVSYNASVNIMDLVTVEEVMNLYQLGPNGALVYCMEFLEQNFDWLLDKLQHLKDSYLVFDMPGQVELYTHHNTIKNIFRKLEDLGYHLCVVHMIDSHYCSDPVKFISTLLLSLSTMLQIGLPHVNILSKADLLRKNQKNLDFNIDFYTDVLDLNYLLQLLDENPFSSKFKKLNASLVSLIEEYSLVWFIPVDIKSESSLLRLKNAVDKANGYVYGDGEERSIGA